MLQKIQQRFVLTFLKGSPALNVRIYARNFHKNINFLVENVVCLDTKLKAK